ncbi:MAG: peptidase S9 [Gemmatimonadales bacterium]|nr:MAG: peptidase S9 [Gemmatimonadales bacterium]
MNLGSRAMRAVAALFCATWTVPAAVAQQADSSGPRPALEDLFTVVSLGSLELSPDGERLLYTVRSADLEKNQTDTEIWLLTLPQRGAPRNVRLTRNPKNDTQPRWHPSGDRFAFLSVRESGSNREERPALYLMSPTGGEPEKLYEHPTGIRSFDWSPDGKWIGFTANDDETEEQKKRREQGRDVRLEDDPGRYTHLWLLDVEARKARRITSGTEFNVQSFAWSPDGKVIAFSATPTPRITDSWKSDLFLIDPFDSTATPRRLTDNPGPDASPVFSPDGEFIYYQGYQSDRYRVGYDRVFRIPKAGGKPEDVSPNMDVDPSPYVFTPDGKAVFFEATTGTTRGIFYMPLDTRRPVRLTGDRGVWSQASFSRDRRRVAFVHESPVKPQEIHAAVLDQRPGEGVLKNVGPLTRHNAHAEKWAVGLTDVIRWKSADGKEIEGILVYPAGWTPARGPAPLVVKIHGGPAGVYLQNFQASSTGSDAQRYAADGYAVFLPNPRGSTGYGDATVRAVIDDWGGMDFKDIMIGVDTLIARRVAHPDSLGVMGWSYGGYMTAWTISQTNRFKAAVVGAGITETISMWGTHDILHVFEGYFSGSPWDEGRWEEYQASSPLAHIRGARTPTLIIHGVNDQRVPPNQAQILYRTLKALGVPTELVWLPRTGHGPNEPGLQYETARRQKEWMDRWIRKKGAKPTAN